MRLEAPGLADLTAPRLAWAPALPPELVARAASVAGEVAERLRDHHRVAQAIAAAATQSAFPRAIGWQPVALAQGDAGLALTCAGLDACFPDSGWDRIGHVCLAAAADGAERVTAVPAGLFGGLAGFAFAGLSLSRGTSRYRRLLSTLDDVLLPQVAAQAEGVDRLTDGGVAFSEFDVISGLTGVGAYLLCRVGDPRAAASLETVLRALTALAQDTGGRPRWWTPADLLGDEDMSARHPYGNLNCGLAHGIPGPLALMALALSRGVAVPGQEDAIDRIAEWLALHRADDAWGVNWPYAVPFAADGAPDYAGAAGEPSRAGWCYGAPGVARALWLAGVARGRPEWRSLAIEAMQAVYHRPVAVRHIDSPTFCHGVAGLLQVTLRFAHDTGRPLFAEAAAELTEQLLSAYEPDSLLGYRSWEPGGTRVDQPGLLDGAPGVLLALLAASTDVEPAWDRAFMLS
ncbi:lanthionine synthetase C family protein [Limobrevibacterium gyesilva]|uniref:Lanthionine synthetase C family protein n=1 Tax=Limobrevibacterium gyesilva TaxID=2991712 RepID=A0AA42CE39_9PROT|nr:lanthionine synthetase C family protein [Limobrevibacterium gyesilva]